MSKTEKNPRNQEEANKVIAEKLEKAHKLIKECEELADKHKCYMNFSLVYGAGAYYNPKSKDSSESEYDGWQASSQGC